MIKYLLFVFGLSLQITIHSMDTEIKETIRRQKESERESSFCSLKLSNSNNNLLEHPSKDEQRSCWGSFLHACLKAFARNGHQDSPFSR
jgi:hypothetical protein